MAYTPRDIEEEKEESKQAAPAPKKKSFLGKIIACALGLVVGVVSGIGSFVAIGGAVVSQPIGSAVDLIDTYLPLDVHALLFGGENTDGYLSSDYETKKVLNLLKDVTSAAKGLSSGKSTLSSFSKISPKVESVIDKMLVAPIRDMGIPIETSELMSKPLKATKEGETDLMTYLLDCVYETPLVLLLGNESADVVLNDNLMMTLCYGQKGTDYIVNEETNKVEMQGESKPRTINYLIENDLTENIRLVDVMPEDKNSALMMYLLHGKKGIHYDFDENGTTVHLKKRMGILSEVAYNEYGEELENYTLTDNENGTYTYTDKTNKDKPVEYLLRFAEDLAPIKTKDGFATTYYMYDPLNLDAENNPVPLYFEPTSLSALTSKNSKIISNITSRLTIAEVMGEGSVSGNMFLKHVANSTIDGLPEAIENLKITEAFEDNVYRKYKPANGEPASYTDIYGKTVNTGDFIREVEIIDSVTYESSYYFVLAETKEDRELAPIWKYLLEKDGVEQPYTVTHMDEIVANMQDNINNATVKQLAHDKLVNGIDEGVTDTEIKAAIGIFSIESELSAAGIPYGEKSNGTKYTIGDLTVTQMMNYMSILLSKI